MKLILPLFVLVLASCSTTSFQTFEGARPVVGTGGSRETIEGIDFWSNGSPPRKFQVVGIIDDDRHGGIIPMAGLKKDVARKARESGANAVILLGSDSRITGWINNSNANSTVNVHPGFATVTTHSYGSSVPLRRNSARYAAIKYL